jgi:hypothetical protein
MRLLVCGDRHWSDFKLVVEVLDGFANQYLWDVVVIHGAAAGADTMAGDWADVRDVPVEVYPAQWDRYGKAAGPIRNQEMLATGIDLVLAFHDDIRNSKGTKHMVNIARDAGIPVKLVYHQPACTNSSKVR